MNVLYRSFAFTSAHLWVLLCIFILPAEPAHLSSVLLWHIGDINLLFELLILAIRLNVERFGRSSKFSDLELNPPNFDNIILLDPVSLRPETPDHHPESIVSTSSVLKGPYLKIIGVFMQREKVCSLFFVDFGFILESSDLVANPRHFHRLLHLDLLLLDRTRFIVEKPMALTRPSQGLHTDLLKSSFLHFFGGTHS